MASTRSAQITRSRAPLRPTSSPARLRRRVAARPALFATLIIAAALVVVVPGALFRARAISGTSMDFVNAVGLGMMIYSGNVVVTWQLSNGRVIGTRTYDYNQLNDYRCTSSYCGIGMTTWGGAYINFTR